MTGVTSSSSSMARPSAPVSAAARRRRSSSASGSTSKPAYLDERDDPVADDDAAAGIVGSEVRHEAHRGPLGQLGEGAARSALAVGAASSVPPIGAAEVAGSVEGAVLTVGAVLWFGVGQPPFSGFVRPPHCSQNAVTLASSNVSSGSTRPHTIAWKGVLIWSNGAMTGPQFCAGGNAS